MFFASPKWLTRKCQQMAKSDTNRKNQSIFANYWNFDFWLFRFLQLSQKIINKNEHISKSLIFLKMRLTDTGEDSKLVHRWKRPKVDTLFSSLFYDASERRVWLSAESKILASTFGRFRLYRLKWAIMRKLERSNHKLWLCIFTIFESVMFNNFVINPCWEEKYFF